MHLEHGNIVAQKFKGRARQTPPRTKPTLAHAYLFGFHMVQPSKAWMLLVAMVSNLLAVAGTYLIAMGDGLQPSSFLLLKPKLGWTLPELQSITGDLPKGVGPDRLSDRRNKKKQLYTMWPEVGAVFESSLGFKHLQPKNKNTLPG